MKLVGAAAAYCSGIGGYCTKLQPQPVEYAGVCGMHDPISPVQAIDPGMEGVGIFHHKFTRPHHTEAGPDLVAKFSLDLIKGDRQLTIALDLAPSNVRNHFLMRWTEAEIALMPIFNF